MTTPSGVIRPIRLTKQHPPKKLRCDFVYQRLPSGPAVMPNGPAETMVLLVLNSVTTPSGVIRPIRPMPLSVNQRLPSGPAVMS